MKKVMLGGLIALILLLVLIWPAAAQAQPEITITKNCPSTACVNQEFECTIHAEYSGPDVAFYPYISDQISGGFNGEITYMSDGGIIQNPSQGHWNPWVQNPPWQIDLTAKILPKETGTLTNVGQALISLGPGQQYVLTDSEQTTTQVNACPGVPEFPSFVFPSAFILGILFMAFGFYVQRTRQQ